MTSSPLCLDTTAAAATLGLSKPWLEQLRSRGAGPKFVKLGRAVRYRPEDLAAWLEAHLVKQAA